MTKPNFAAMATEELRAYVLKHRNNDEAFYTLADRIDAEGTELQSLDHLAEVVEAKRKAREERTE